MILEIAKGFTTDLTSYAGEASEPLVNTRTMKEVVLEYLESPPDHFKGDGRCPKKHAKFVGVETVNSQNKSGIPEKVKFWEIKCEAQIMN